MSPEGKGIIHVVRWHLGTEESAAFPAKRLYISPTCTALSSSQATPFRPFCSTPLGPGAYAVRPSPLLAWVMHFHFSFFRLAGRRKGFLRSLLTISRGTPPRLPCGRLPAGTTINCVLCSDFIVTIP